MILTVVVWWKYMPALFFLIIFFLFSPLEPLPVPSTFNVLESSKEAAPSIQGLQGCQKKNPTATRTAATWEACTPGEGGGAQELSETVPGNTYRKLRRKRLEMNTNTFTTITPSQHLGCQVSGSLMAACTFRDDRPMHSPVWFTPAAL